MIKHTISSDAAYEISGLFMNCWEWISSWFLWFNRHGIKRSRTKICHIYDVFEIYAMGWEGNNR